LRKEIFAIGAMVRKGQTLPIGNRNTWKAKRGKWVSAGTFDSREEVKPAVDRDKGDGFQSPHKRDGKQTGLTATQTKGRKTQFRKVLPIFEKKVETSRLKNSKQCTEKKKGRGDNVGFLEKEGGVPLQGKK